MNLIGCLCIFNVFIIFKFIVFYFDVYFYYLFVSFARIYISSSSFESYCYFYMSIIKILPSFYSLKAINGRSKPDLGRN